MTKRHAPPPTRYQPSTAVAQAKPSRPMGHPPPPTRYQISAATAQAKPGVVQRVSATDALRSRLDRDAFQPWNAANPTRANFEALRNGAAIDVAALMLVVPVDADDDWVVIPGRTTRGFKYTWNDGANDWEVWGHEPDQGAAAGHAGAAGWTVRIKCGNQYLMDQQIVPPVGGAYDWAPGNSAARVQHSHIALTGV
jgi:hypothetical protein